jgi:hypothetical protein
MNARPQYHSIEGLSTTEPVGAVLTVGTKGPNGYPINTDRFYIKVRQENENRIRVDHPLFNSYNSADAGKRQTIRGNLVHATRAEAWVHHLRAQVLGKAWRPFEKSHPLGRPICSGDGVKATRLHGIAEARRTARRTGASRIARTTSASFDRATRRSASRSASCCFAPAGPKASRSRRRS